MRWYRDIEEKRAGEPANFLAAPAPDYWLSLEEREFLL